MFCPNCGANNSTEQKFCRSCGLNLEKSAESLLEQLPSAQSAILRKHEKFIEKFGNFALGGFGVTVFLGVIAIIYKIIEKFVLNGADIFTAVMLIGFVVFAFLSLIFVIFNENLKEKKAKLQPDRKSEFEIKTETVNLLADKPFEPVSSVTENSTELLYAENKTRKLE